MDWQNQHCEKGYTTKDNLYVRCNPYQNSNDILHRDRTINPETHMETQKTSNSQSNSEKKSNAGDIVIPDFKLYFRAVTIKQYSTDTKTDMKTYPCSYSQLIFNKRAQST
jgi:hypothetical protein